MDISNLNLIFQALYAYLIFTIIFVAGFIYCERRAVKKPKDKFTKWWRKNIVGVKK